MYRPNESSTGRMFNVMYSFQVLVRSTCLVPGTVDRTVLYRTDCTVPVLVLYLPRVPGIAEWSYDRDS
jgi:hypothetical protein